MFSRGWELAWPEYSRFQPSAFPTLRDPRAGVQCQQWKIRDLHPGGNPEQRRPNPKSLLFLRSAQPLRKVGIFLKMCLERVNFIKI